MAVSPRPDLFDLLPVGCLVTGPDGIVEEGNRKAAEMLDLTPATIRGASILELTHPDDRAALRSILESPPPGEQVREKEVRFLRRRGDCFAASILSGKGWEGDGGRRSVLLFHDITPRIEERGRTIEAEKSRAISGFTRDLTHEARNAIQPCLFLFEALSDALSQELPDRGEAIADLSQLKKSFDQLMSLFVLVREYTDTITLKLQPGDLGEVLEEAWCFLGPLRQGRDATLSISRPEIDLSMDLDRPAMERAFRYLLHGSLRMCSDPVRIEADWREVWMDGRSSGRQLRLRDNGPGFLPQEKHRVFLPFGKSKALGADLRMAVARKIVEAHGGSVRFGESPWPGLEILVTFPPHPSTAARES
jgi:PAS domain S-box-containing protein